MWIKDSASLFARKIRCYISKSCQLQSHFLRRLSQWDSLTTSCFSTLAQFGLNVCLHSWQGWHQFWKVEGTWRNAKKNDVRFIFTRNIPTCHYHPQSHGPRLRLPMLMAVATHQRAAMASAFCWLEVGQRVDHLRRRGIRLGFVTFRAWK